jgi:hypothetical protein
MIGGARAAKAELRYGEAAQEWTCGPGGVSVRTARDRYSSGALVLTAGSGKRTLTKIALAAFIAGRSVGQKLRSFAPSQVDLAN